MFNTITNRGGANVFLSGGTLSPLNTDATWSAAMVLNNVVTINTRDAHGQPRSVNLSGALSGGGELDVIGTGTLLLNSTDTGGSLIKLFDGVTLGGIGSVASLQIQSNATLAAGSLLGTFSASNLTLSAGAHIQEGLNATSGVAGVDWDLISVAGAVTLSGLSRNTPLIVDVVNVGGLTGSAPSTTALSWTFLTASNGISGYDPNCFALTNTGLPGWTNGVWAVAIAGNSLQLLYSPLSTVSVQANPSNSGGVVGGGTYVVGTNVQLAATASNNWLFINWNDGTTNDPYTITVPATNSTYIANFVQTAAITVNDNTNAGGTVTGSGTFIVGSTNQITAVASNGWAFTGWSDGNTQNPRSIVVGAGGATYTASFSPLGTITVLANPTSGGSVTGGGLYVGSNATVTASASNNWRFLNWNGTITNNPWVFPVVSGSTLCTANFARLSTVVGLANPATAGSVAGGGAYVVGSNATLTAVASNSWSFTKWNDNSVLNPRTITVPLSNITYTATFVPPVTVTVRANPAANGNVSGGGTFQIGSNVTLAATAVSGWRFTTWNDGNTNASHSVMVPAVNVTYTAGFAMDIGAAVDATNLNWTTGGNANWAVQTATTRDGVAALKSGAIGAGQQTWFQTTTNGPGSLQFWWKVSSAPTNQLQFYINTQLVSQISGNVDWNQVVTFLGTSNQVTLKWVYAKNTAAVSGSDAGWVDQVTWTPCPYAEHVPQMFYQDPSGMLASWVLNSTGGIRFTRVLANTGGWALKAAGDVDGDGVSDLLFENAAGDTGGWFMNADGSVRSALYWFNIGAWEIKACADYEGTGRGQMFFQNAAGVAAYWRLDTNGNFQSAVILGNMGGWKLRGAGDLDGDHKAELFWQNAAGQVAVWYHNPDDSIRGAIPFSTGSWALCGVTDIDGDGICDLLWQNPAGDTGGWFMNSNSTARSANFWWNTGAWKLKAAGR
jgi:hypothetical protein